MDAVLLRPDLLLRPLTTDDADALFALVDANRPHLGAWLPFVGATKTVEDTRAFLQARTPPREERDGFEMGLVHEGRLVGALGAHGIDRHFSLTSLGYWLAEDAQGRGLMTDAVRAVVTHAFRDLGLHRVEIRVAPGNERSAAIPRRLGFVEEGTLRECARAPGGGWFDLRVFGMLAHEWR